MNSRAVGIDLGTTNTVAAAVSAAGHTEVLRTREGESQIPSIVLFDDERTIVGREAQLRGRAQPDRLAACAKRQIGQAWYAHAIGGESLPPEVIEACILEQAKREWLGGINDLSRVVIAVPAHFNELQRRATAMAAEIAGIHLLDLVNEPIAAALAFAEDAPLFSIADAHSGPRAVLVFDLGGYTFETTLLSVRPGEMTMVATDHDSFLGGHDWDLRLADMLAEPFVRQHGFDPREKPHDLDALVQRAIQVKHALAFRSHAAIHLQFQGRSETIRITRSQFEGGTTDLVERVGGICDRLLMRAGWGWSRVSQVLLVGGTTRMSMIRRMLAQRLGREADGRVCAEEAVARGAALHAAGMMVGGNRPPTLRVVSTSTHSLGIERISQQTGERINKVVIPKGTALPARVTREFFAKSNAERNVGFNILEGEDPNASHCVQIGRVLLRDLPPDVSDSWPVEITYEYSPGGQLVVDARARYTDCVVHLETVRPAGVSQTHVAHWQKAVAAQSGFSAYREVRAWERAADAPGPVVVAGLPSEATAETASQETFLKRLMPFLFRPHQPTESANPATGNGPAAATAPSEPPITRPG